ncbi:DUF4232 domain-containing protein [Embleya sp. NPDC020630]|uniref:DUF4232 domain-containing protein n=1 Tax=Embleya sp. NPDC020630 TaxID=3363979 RepID=UPI0037AD0EF3
MSANRRRTVLASATLVAGVLLTSACQDSDSGAAKGTSSNAPGAQAPAAPNTANPGGSQGANSQSGQSSQGGTQSSGTQGGANTSGGQSSGGQGTSAGAATTSGGGGNGKAAKCRTDNLKATAIDGTIGGDSDGTVAVTFKNNGPDCSMAGYAGVDLKTDAGEIPAQRTGQQPVSFVLESGKSVSFGINYPLETMGEASGLRITGLVVTPPDETKSVTLNWPGVGRLPVKSGDAPIKVGPIGSAGQGG